MLGCQDAYKPTPRTPCYNNDNRGVITVTPDESRYYVASRFVLSRYDVIPNPESPLYDKDVEY